MSIVDTFGSMYQEDLHRVFEIINHNLIKSCKIGFHSHNNMQLSSALSQEFIRMTVGKREIVVDGTINGMGRGAGNTPTELIVQYMNQWFNASYDIDALLDVIDGYMDNIRTRCNWGYSTQYFVAGCYSAHVNNIAYLAKKNSIRSRDIRYILNRIGPEARKRYDYDLFEKTYLDLLQFNIDDKDAISKLKNEISNREVLILAPGRTVMSEKDKILGYVKKNKPFIIAVQFMHDSINADYIYMSNVKRYRYWKNYPAFVNAKKILTSNIANEEDVNKSVIVSFIKYIKCGWENIDNSTIMLLRLLDEVGVAAITIAGFDGYSYSHTREINYASKFLELSSAYENPLKLNQEISSMLCDYIMTRKHNESTIRFLTESRFANSVNPEKIHTV